MKTELIVSGFWLLLAAYLVFAADKLGLGAIGRPGPGFFPFGAAIAVAVITSIRLLRARNQEPPVILATRPSEWRKIGYVVCGMAAFAFLLDSLGFALCTFLLMLFYLKIIALQRWQLSVGFALVVALLAHLFFDVLLNAQLPRGILESFL
ncbi:MAG TPA: tripartite tricarboxylate transporter TctB family protein [Candidatus Binatia bacterium]